MLDFNRPGTGIPPSEYNNLLAKSASKDIEDGHVFTPGDFI